MNLKLFLMIFKDYTINSKFLSFLDDTFYIKRMRDEILEITGGAEALKNA